jgi:hypothetical protein
MLHKNMHNNLWDGSDYPLELDFYFINDKNDLAEFISKHFRGKASEINQIPIKKWFLYSVDDIGDYINDYITLVSDYKKNLLDTIINASIMYKQLENVN